MDNCELWVFTCHSVLTVCLLKIKFKFVEWMCAWLNTMDNCELWVFINRILRFPEFDGSYKSVRAIFPVALTYPQFPHAHKGGGDFFCTHDVILRVNSAETWGWWCTEQRSFQNFTGRDDGRMQCCFVH